MNVFLRFRLARPLTSKVSKGGQLYRDICPIGDEEIKQKWDDVKRCFIEGKEYGSFNAVVILAGEHTAHHLLKEQWVSTRGFVNSVTRHESNYVPDQQLEDDDELMVIQDPRSGRAAANRRRMT